MKKIELSKPIQAHGEEVTHLEVKEPNFGDLMELDKAQGDLGKMAKLIEVLCCIPASSVKTLSVKDVAKIQTEIMPFLADFQEIGGM